MLICIQAFCGTFVTVLLYITTLFLYVGTFFLSLEYHEKGGFIATKNKLIISFNFQTCFPFVQIPVCSVSADVFLWELVSIWLCLPATISSFYSF